jgi:SAM-dependent methyltransferase
LLDVNVDYSAVESDEQMREELSAKGISAYADLADVEGSPFDLIILSHVVEHVQSPVEFLRLASECLSEDGVLFVEVPNQDDFFKLDLGLHLAVYNPSAIATLCDSAGLFPAEVSTAGVAIDDLRPTFIRRFEYKLKHTSTLAYRIWRRARRVFSAVDQKLDINAPLSRSDNRGRWLRVLARKRMPSVF